MKSFPAEGRHEALNENLKSQMPRLVGGVIHSGASFIYPPSAAIRNNIKLLDEY